MRMQWDQHRFEAQGWTWRWCLWLLSVADVVEFELLFLLGALVPVPMSGLQLTGRRSGSSVPDSQSTGERKKLRETHIPLTQDLNFITPPPTPTIPFS